ncbi:MAG: hypothetical protein JO339_16150 [Alphaproteobacteria bacterium]|nr:hypothetical protein [Alphaproteobacteria bacterium]
MERKMDRVLVCVIAQVRGHQVTWKSFKRNVLDELEADLALCISVEHDFDYSNPFWQHARWKWAAPEYADFGDGFDQAQRWLAKDAGIEPPEWRPVMKIPLHWIGGIKGEHEQETASGILIYFRWLLLHNILREGLLEKYDRIIVTRSDFIWNSPHPPMSILSGDHIWFPDGEYFGGLTDRHSVIPSKYVTKSLDLIDNIVLRPRELQEAMAFHGLWNLEKYICFHLRRQGLRPHARKFPYVMYAVRQPEDQTRWAPGHYDEDMGLFVKYPSELASCRKFSQVKTRFDWRDLARTQPALFSDIPRDFQHFDLRQWVPDRLLTFHGTVLYLGPESELRHGPIDDSPSNLIVAALGKGECLLGAVPEGRRRVVFYMQRHTYPYPDVHPVELEEIAAPVVRIIPVSAAEDYWFGLELDGNFLSATPGGQVSWTPHLRYWEWFRCLGVESSRQTTTSGV